MWMKTTHGQESLRLHHCICTVSKGCCGRSGKQIVGTASTNQAGAFTSVLDVEGGLGFAMDTSELLIELTCILFLVHGHVATPYKEKTSNML